MGGDTSYPYRFVWRNTPEREKLFNKRCRILSRGGKKRSIVVEFEDGERVICSDRAIRRDAKWPDDFRGFGTNVKPPKQ